MTAKVPIKETGMAITGMMAARQLCRNTSTTRMTRSTASSMVLINSAMDSATNSVGL